MSGSTLHGMIRSAALLSSGVVLLVLVFTVGSLSIPALALLGAIAILAGLISTVLATVAWSRRRRAELLAAVERGHLRA